MVWPVNFSDYVVRNEAMPMISPECILLTYLVVSGLYTSTVSLSQNTEVRRSIRRLAGSQSALFDSMVSAESEKEIEKRVMEIVRKESVEMANRSGVEISLSDIEAKKYLEEVIKEIKK